MVSRRTAAALLAAVGVAAAALVGLRELRRPPSGGAAGEEGPAFIDAAQRWGITRELAAGSPEKLFIFENVGSGAGILDYDGDGLLDIFLASGGAVRGGKVEVGRAATLYRQEPGGRWEDVSAAVGIRAEAWGTGVAVGDLENDGYPDVFLGTLAEPLLFRNQAGRSFRESGRESGLTRSGFATSAVFLDYDRDGLLDLYVARYVEFDFDHPPNGGKPCLENGVAISCGPTIHRPLPHLLYRNLGDGRLEDVTERAGLGHQEGSYGLGVAAGDLDGDGWPDIYAANDTTPNFLWHNRRDGTFEEIGIESGCALSENAQGQSGMGVDLGDADGDGRPEIFVSNYSEEYNAYYANLGDSSFADRTYASGLTEGCFLTLGWGTKFIDYDQDGALDLFVVNGHVHPRAHDLNPSLSYQEPILFYRGDGAGRFRLAPAGELGADAALPRAHRGAAVGDLDGDGDLDLVVTVLDSRPLVLLNQLGQRRAALVLRLRGVRSNREGIGARVELEAGGRKQVREVTRGGSYLSSSDAVAHFGLGERDRAEKVRIRWPSGQIDELGPLAGGWSYLVEEGGAIIGRTPHRPPGVALP